MCDHIVLLYVVRRTVALIIICATVFLAGFLVTAVIAVGAITAVAATAATARSIVRASGFGGIGLNLCLGFKPGFLCLKIRPYLFH